MAKTKNKSNSIGIILFTIFVLLIISGIIVVNVINRPKEIPVSAVGNTPGNIINKGLFCESDGYVYFANTYDQRKLYKMKADGTELKRIADVPCEFINVYGDDVFFYQTPGADDQVFGLGGLYGVCSTDIKGKSGMHNIDKTIVNSLILYGPELYYQHYDKAEGLRLYKANPRTKEKAEISDKKVYVSTPVNGKFMTYNEENGYYLSLYNPANDQMELFDNDTRAYNVILEDQYVYYMNIDDNYRIYRMNLSNHEKEKLSDYTVDVFNVYGDNIFFQRNSADTPALMHMKTNGSGERIVASGNFTNINCTSTYTYFYEFGDAGAIYKVPTSGGTAEKFVP
ncbi:MAG: DUF5050 domain-containing protein [Lachnospiraceae bacterium]|nr:DUF5050 domain-containing protein [Lachnospiraceae bacterium]